MKKQLILLCLCFLFTCSFGQKKKGAKEKIEVDPKVMEQLKQHPSAKKAFLEEMNKEEDENNGPLQLPVRQTVKLNAIPSATFTQAAFVTYLKDVEVQLAKKIRPEKVQAVNATATALHNDVVKMGEAGLAGWYNGSQQEAVLLLTRAAIMNPNNLEILNNLSAFMNLGGAPHKAIPVLRYLVQFIPQNDIVLNNMGQAYAALGEIDSANFYFNRCLKIEPEHHQANLTMGLLAAAAGNSIQARSCFVNVLHKGYNKTAAKMLREIDPLIIIGDQMKSKVKAAGYFNPNKYELPRQLEDVKLEKKVRQEQEDFDEWMRVMVRYYSALAEQADIDGDKEMADMQRSLTANMQKLLSGKTIVGGPLLATAQQVMLELAMDDGYRQEMLRKYIANRELEIKALLDEYKNANDNLSAEHELALKNAPVVGEGHDYTAIDKAYCAKSIDLKNMTLAKVAGVRRAIQEKQRVYANQKVENGMYWGSLNAITPAHGRVNFYIAAQEYLRALELMSVTTYMSQDCNEVPEPQAIEKAPDAIKYKCPISINIPLVIIKVKLSCEEFEISGGEGIRFKYSKDFSSGSSTLSLGVGLGFEISRGGALSQGTISAEVSQCVYITFDGNNSIADVGLETKARAALEGGLNTGEIIEVDGNSIGGAVELGFKVGTGVDSGPNGERGPGMEFNGNGWQAVDGALSAVLK